MLDHDHSETASGHEEWTHETAVAKKGHKFVRVSLREHLRFLGGPGAGISIDGKEITEREYKALAAGNEIIDSPEALAELTERKERAAYNDKLHRRFMETAPACPKCGTKMVNRKGPRGEFWGCSNFPKCRGSVNFSFESRKRYQAYIKDLMSDPL